MGEDEETIDFISLETELNQVIQDDIKYWQQNDAKIRAVNQRVATYDDFREIVNAAHLKPLDKKESLQMKTELNPNNSIWNSISSTKKKLAHSKQNLELEKKELDQGQEDQSALTLNLVQRLRKASDPSVRYNLLKTAEPDVLEAAFKTEIPVDLFGEIIETLLKFPDTTSDITTVTRILKVFTQTKRFSINLAFLSSKERTQCKELLQKLGSSIKSKKLCLSEQDVTECTVSNLMSLFKI